MGLKGTGSKDIVVNDVFVPEYRTHKGSDGFMGTNPGRHTFTADPYKPPFGPISVRAASSAATVGLRGALNSSVSFSKARRGETGRAQDRTPLTNAHLVSRLLPAKKKNKK